MYRHSPVRNVRSKGIKIKHVLQICLLVAVCFWLIFQVKRSHDKKKELDTSDTKISLSTKGGEEIVKFGRKDLQPKLEEKVVKQEEEEQEHEHEQEDQEENKHEEEEEEQDEEKIEDEKDDEIDENEQEKSDVDIDRGEEVDAVDEESDEKENEENDGQGQSQSQPETEVSLDESDQDGATRNTREAREEHYKADDASSAVTHDSLTVGIENGNGTLDNSVVDNGETAKNGASSSSSNVTEIEENGPPSNTTIVKPDSTEAQTKEVVSNSTVSEETGKTSNSSNILEVSEENSKTEVESEENLDSYEGKNRDEVEHERIDSGDLSHLEEKEVRTDLETLPEIETEGSNSEDSAVE